MVQHFLLKGYSFILGTSGRREVSQRSYGTARCTQQVSKSKERKKKKKTKKIWAGPLQQTGRQRLSGSFTFVFKMSHRSQKSQRDQPSPTLLEGTHDRTQNKLNPSPSSSQISPDLLANFSSRFLIHPRHPTKPTISKTIPLSLSVFFSRFLRYARTL